MSSNQISNWISGQIVIAEEMNAFTNDLYTRFAQYSDTIGGASGGCILTLASLTQGSGEVTVGAGNFRFPTTYLAYTQYSPCIEGAAPEATVAVSGDGFIVARYTVDPVTPDNTNYNFTITYQFVASVNATTDCLVCAITSGIISGYGRFYNTPHINDNYITSKIDITCDNNRPSLINYATTNTSADNLMVQGDINIDAANGKIVFLDYEIIVAGQLVTDASPYTFSIPFVGSWYRISSVIVTPASSNPGNYYVPTSGYDPSTPSFTIYGANSGTEFSFIAMGSLGN